MFKDTIKLLHRLVVESNLTDKEIARRCEIPVSVVASIRGGSADIDGYYAAKLAMGLRSFWKTV